MVIYMKKALVCMLLVLITFMFGSTVYAKEQVLEKNSYILIAAKDDNFDTNCADFSPAIRMGGVIIFLVKIAIPLIIIFKSSLNLYSAVTSGNPDELKKKVNKLLISCGAGMVIFFVPTVINTVFNLVESYRNNMTSTNDAYICKECIFNPFGPICDNAAKKANED